MIKIIKINYILSKYVIMLYNTSINHMQTTYTE